jgi:hypothetical protein
LTLEADGVIEAFTERGLVLVSPPSRRRVVGHPYVLKPTSMGKQPDEQSPFVIGDSIRSLRAWFSRGQDRVRFFTGWSPAT